MRGRIALALLICVVVAGCGEERPRPAERLDAWTFPRAVLVPRVDDATPAAAAPTPRRGATRPARAAPAPASSDLSPGAPSDAEVRAQLRELYGRDAGAGASGADPALARRVALDGGAAFAPPDAPDAVQRIVEAANQVARLPYVYGGGHGRAEGLFVDSAYDCSGSISFALANAGLIDAPMTSGAMAGWGAAGPGRWVTIYANAGHAFMVVGGARFDTVGLRQTGSRWQRPFRTVSGFTARHPPGL
jgi:cell wall-associated NlpC family hydrolase